MNWWNLFGMNPKYKDFIEKYPNKTMLGLGWAFYWRFMVLVLVLEAIFAVLFVIFSVFVF